MNNKSECQQLNMHGILYQVYELNMMTLSGAVVLRKAKRKSLMRQLTVVICTEDISQRRVLVFQVIYLNAILWHIIL